MRRFVPLPVSFRFDEPRDDDEDQPPRLEQVRFAIEPVDALTGQVVRGPLKLTVAGLPNRPRRNLSGMYVFLYPPKKEDWPDDDTYVVEIQGRAAGYFDAVKEVPPLKADPSDVDLFHRVPLRPRPSHAFLAETTLVRGQVRLGGQPAPGAEVSATSVAVPRPPQVRRFATSTDANGSFALPLRLSERATGEPPTERFRFEISFGEPPHRRAVLDDVTEGGASVFVRPIELTAAAGTLPGLTPTAT